MKLFIVSFVFSTIIFCILTIIKSSNTYVNHDKILKAIDAYTEKNKNYDKGLLLLDNMESFYSTLLRLTDWGYKNILPKEDFELIKPYIK